MLNGFVQKYNLESENKLVLNYMKECVYLFQKQQIKRAMSYLIIITVFSIITIPMYNLSQSTKQLYLCEMINIFVNKH